MATDPAVLLSGPGPQMEKDDRVATSLHMAVDPPRIDTVELDGENPMRIPSPDGLTAKLEVQSVTSIKDESSSPQPPLQDLLLEDEDIAKEEEEEEEEEAEKEVLDDTHLDLLVDSAGSHKEESESPSSPDDVQLPVPRVVVSDLGSPLSSTDKESPGQGILPGASIKSTTSRSHNPGTVAHENPDYLSNKVHLDEKGEKLSKVAELLLHSPQPSPPIVQKVLVPTYSDVVTPPTSPDSSRPSSLLHTDFALQNTSPSPAVGSSSPLSSAHANPLLPHSPVIDHVDPHSSDMVAIPDADDQHVLSSPVPSLPPTVESPKELTLPKKMRGRRGSKQLLQDRGPGFNLRVYCAGLSPALNYTILSAEPSWNSAELVKMLVEKHHIEADPAQYCLVFTPLKKFLGFTRSSFSKKTKLLQDDESPVLRGMKSNAGRLEIVRKDNVPVRPKKHGLICRLKNRHRRTSVPTEGFARLVPLHYNRDSILLAHPLCHVGSSPSETISSIVDASLASPHHALFIVHRDMLFAVPLAGAALRVNGVPQYWPVRVDRSDTVSFFNEASPALSQEFGVHLLGPLPDITLLEAENKIEGSFKTPHGFVFPPEDSLPSWQKFLYELFVWFDENADRLSPSSSVPFLLDDGAGKETNTAPTPYVRHSVSLLQQQGQSSGSSLPRNDLGWDEKFDFQPPSDLPYSPQPGISTNLDQSIYEDTDDSGSSEHGSNEALNDGEGDNNDDEELPNSASTKRDGSKNGFADSQDTSRASSLDSDEDPNESRRIASQISDMLLAAMNSSPGPSPPNQSSSPSSSDRSSGSNSRGDNLNRGSEEDRNGYALKPTQLSNSSLDYKSLAEISPRTSLNKLRLSMMKTSHIPRLDWVNHMKSPSSDGGDLSPSSIPRLDWMSHMVNNLSPLGRTQERPRFTPPPRHMFAKPKTIDIPADVNLKTPRSKLSQDELEAAEDLHREVVLLLQSHLCLDKFRTQDLFTRFDVDRNNKISREEYFQGLTLLGYNISPEDLNLLFDYLDVDGDDALNLAEFGKGLMYTYQRSSLLPSSFAQTTPPSYDSLPGGGRRSSLPVTTISPRVKTLIAKFETRPENPSQRFGPVPPFTPPPAEGGSDVDMFVLDEFDRKAMTVLGDSPAFTTHGQPSSLLNGNQDPDRHMEVDPAFTL